MTSPKRNNEEVYDVFHDECKADGYWHCYIFVPRSSQKRLFDLLMESRSNLKYYERMHFRTIRRNDKSHTDKVRMVRSWISILLCSIQQQKLDGAVYLGHKGNKPVCRKIRVVDKPIGARLVIMRKRGGLRDMFANMPYEKKVEATFKMGLKGGIHYLFVNEDVRIGNVYMDDPEVVYAARFNAKNILARFRKETRDNVYLEEDSDIIPISSKEYTIGNIVDEFMQLADVAVGSMRCQVLCHTGFSARYEATKPIKDELLSKDTVNFARMKNSRYFKGFVLSDAWLADGVWEFDVMKVNRTISNLCLYPSP